MVPDDRLYASQGAQIAAQLIAHDRVLLHAFELFPRQDIGLQEDRVRQRDLADIVKIPATTERRDRIFVKAQPHADVGGIQRETLAMAVGVGIARLDHERQAAQDVFSRVQVVGETLDLHQRSTRALSSG